MQLKPIAVSIALSVASSALTAAIVLTVARPPSAAADAGIIKARELDLIDDNGATEAQLTLTGQGAALLLNDANGVTRVFLSGSSGIAQVNDSSGLTRAGMGTGDSGVPAVWLADSGRQNVVLLRQQADGTGVVATRLKDGSLVQVSP